jgi:hypothetical protein
MENLFKKEKEIFPITVDYDYGIYEAWKKVLQRTVAWGDVHLKKVKFLHQGICKFNCYFATLQEGSELWDKEKIFIEHNIVPADVMQLFAFACAHPIKKIIEANKVPIVAAAEGSTAKCSHDLMHTVVCLDWNTYYRNPGPLLHTEFAPFEKGTRFLAIS